MSGVSNIMRQTKGSEAKAPVSCPNIMKLYNNGMSGAYRLDCKSKYCFYLRMFFDLLDVTLVNSYIFYKKFGNNISLLKFKTVVTKALIGRYKNRNRSFFTTQLSK